MIWAFSHFGRIWTDPVLLDDLGPTGAFMMAWAFWHFGPIWPDSDLLNNLDLTLLNITLVLLVFVDISCYYMRQGGLMMTCHKALCSQPEPKVPESSNEEAEKVPLAPENGK